MRYSNNDREDIKSLTLSELKEQMESMGEKPFRAKQMYEWMHKKLVTEYEEMTNIPAALADKCRERYSYTVLETVRVQESKADGTKKYLFKMADCNIV